MSVSGQDTGALDIRMPGIEASNIEALDIRKLKPPAQFEKIALADQLARYEFFQ